MFIWLLSYIGVGIIILDICVALFFNVQIPVLIVSFLISLVNFFSLKAALRDKFTETMQEGVIQYTSHPFRFIRMCILYFFGYVVGLLGPWII